MEIILYDAQMIKKIEDLQEFQNLDNNTKDFVLKIYGQYGLTLQEARSIVIISKDFQMWKYHSFETVFLNVFSQITKENSKLTTQQLKDKILKRINTIYKEQLSRPIKYTTKNTFSRQDKYKVKLLENQQNKSIIGKCPVFSEKTRCCNLITIDAIESCSFACSYCSVQTFYEQNTIGVNDNLERALDNFSIDPFKTYHFGSGQSSDSLLLGNQYNTIESLNNFAKRNKNVIIELKTKSSNIDYFKKNIIAKNLICTWSLNPDIVILNEEHATARLHERILAAKELSKLGILVGFHLHPIMYIDHFEKHYGDLVDRIINEFDTKDVVMISLGTLTFTKKIMKTIRSKKEIESQVLKFAPEIIAGKYSYSENIKEKMFKFVFDKFKPWHGKVFFYLCMEDHNLWKKVFNFEYKTNDDFEKAMKEMYFEKINFTNNKKEVT